MCVLGGVLVVGGGGGEGARENKLDYIIKRFNVLSI